ncbi:transglycosylase SLT domain-containing protein [candidate division KSB1 bacterium]|nr:transglycosylase SLT domain-containing protein [candidate division KSB1 bacterium]
MHKVLIVDDDPKICHLFQVTLGKAGYEMIVAQTAQQGLEIALQQRPDVIISDYMMPDMNGVQFCKEVRRQKSIASTPFIVITGRGTRRLKTEGLSSLFDDYIEKPVDLGFLVAKVNAVIRRRREDFLREKKNASRVKTIITTLVIVIIVATSFASGYKIMLNSEKKEVARLAKLKEKYDKRIIALENQLDSLGWELDDLDFNRLNQELNHLIRKAKKISRELPEEKERDLIIRGIKQVMAEFGEENYIVPPLFASEVAKMIRYFSGPKRIHMKKNLQRSKEYLPMIRRVFREKGLPEVLAYIAMVESGFNPNAYNQRSGAAGMWQFMPHTAREYGLRVDRYKDERSDPFKSTLAAREYLIDLIGIFGKESFMLALASYNVGDGKVRHQLKKLYNPFEERDFWYLFRKRALPQETREYIPKVIASIIIHRNADNFGFGNNLNGLQTKS